MTGWNIATWKETEMLTVFSIIARFTDVRTDRRTLPSIAELNTDDYSIALARAGKVKSQTPKVEPQEKKKTPKGRARKRLIYTRRFVNVTLTGGKRKVRTRTKLLLRRDVMKHIPPVDLIEPTTAHTSPDEPRPHGLNSPTMISTTLHLQPFYASEHTKPAM